MVPKNFDPRTTREVEKTRSTLNAKPDPQGRRAPHHRGDKPKGEENISTSGEAS